MDDKALDEAEARLIAFLEHKRQISKATGRLRQIARMMVNPATESLSTDANAKVRKPVRPRHITDGDLPILRGPIWALERYGFALAKPSSIQLDIPFTETPGLRSVFLVPWIIEAPLNSVEILEAILKPSHPFQIHTARHVHRGCNRTATDKRDRREHRKMHPSTPDCRAGWSSIARSRSSVFLGRRFRPCAKSCGECSHLCCCNVSQFPGTTWPVANLGTSLGSGVATTNHISGRSTRTRKRFEGLLKELGLSHNQFQRSLVKHGTTPIPECVLDWFVGRPGTKAALPYLAAPEEVDATREDQDALEAIKAKHTGPLEDIASCCLPTVEKW